MVDITASNLKAGSDELFNQNQLNETQTGNLNINANNLNIQAGMQLNQRLTEDKTTRTLMFRNSNESLTNLSVINSNLEAKDGNFNFEIAERINVSGKLDNSSNYLDYLSNDKSDITKLTNLEDITLRESDAVRGTTDAGNVAIVAGVIAISFATAGLGTAPASAAGSAGGAAAGTATAATATGATAGATAAAGAAATTTAVGAGAAAGAITTTAATQITLASALAKAGTAAVVAGATSLASTAAVTAINTSMNVDGDFFKQVKDISSETYEATTSDESLKNAAIAAGVAFASTAALQLSGGTTSLEPGKDYAVYKPSDKLIAENPDLYSNYNGVIDPGANNIGMANITDKIYEVGTPVAPYSTNPLTANFWQGFLKEGGFISNGANKIGGMNSMSLTHDPISNNAIMGTSPILQLTIPPAIAMQYCATSPVICGAVSGDLVNNNKFGTEK